MQTSSTPPGSAVVLLSGGLDSATVAAMARQQGYTLYGLSFRYGQRHDHEVQAAARLAQAFGFADHRVVALDLRQFGGSALTSDALAVPKDRTDSDMSEGVPVTYVPARNTIFLSMALAYAEVLGAWDVFIGVNAVDYSGYPDCRGEFIEAFETMANLATRASVEGRRRLRIHAPLLAMTKAEIIRRGTELGVDYHQTHSCYDPDERGRACGHCDACQLRRKGFADAGVPDPTGYADAAGE